jgi:IPT/TIG domain-containing protein
LIESAEGAIDTGTSHDTMPGMATAARRATAAVLLGAVGCGAGAQQPIGIAQLTPVAAYNDGPVAASIDGGPFRPAYRFDTVSGVASLDAWSFSASLILDSADSLLAPGEQAGPTSFAASTVVWESASLLGATIPAGLPAGAYDLVVRDPHGQSARRSGAFTSLGPDLTPPLVTIVEPTDGEVVGAGAEVDVVVKAQDGYGQLVSLTVEVGTDSAPGRSYDCTTAAQAGVPCTFSFMAPTAPGPQESVYLAATAVDGGMNAGTARAVLMLVPAPVTLSLSPTSGSTNGDTLVTLQGSNFVNGSTLLLFDGVPGFITSQSATTITAIAPAHIAGAAVVTVEIGGATATVSGGFLYLAPPLVRAISPTRGRAAGGTAVTVVGDDFQPSTRIAFGGVALVCPTVVNANRIEGLTPPGSGEAPVTAADPVLGASDLGGATFSYDADAGADAEDSGAAALPDGGCPGSHP